MRSLCGFGVLHFPPHSLLLFFVFLVCPFLSFLSSLLALCCPCASVELTRELYEYVTHTANSRPSALEQSCRSFRTSDYSTRLLSGCRAAYPMLSVYSGRIDADNIWAGVRHGRTDVAAKKFKKMKRMIRRSISHLG